MAAQATQAIAQVARLRHDPHPMALLLLEILLALALAVLIVWWVMFAGRRKGERDTPPD